MQNFIIKKTLGHKPISMYLAFLSTWIGYLEDVDYIITANEHSSNFGTMEISGITINHQYSKSYEFEKLFQNLLKERNLKPFYFSILRPLYELQIAKIFSRFNKYHNLFVSCNLRQSTSEWCGKCAKCAFVYLILAPFIDNEQLKEIFGSDLIEDKKIREEIIKLCDEKQKPFECVGDINESKLALAMLLEKDLEVEFSEYPKREDFELALDNIDVEEYKEKYLSFTEEENSIPENFKEKVLTFFKKYLD